MSGRNRLAGPGLAVVTGASSGIGAALAQALARRHYDLMLVARSKDVMRRQAADLATDHGVRADVRALDLTDAGQRRHLAEELSTLPVDVLCANAGTAGFGPFATLDNIGQAELNVTSTVVLLDAVVPGMLARRRGGLLLTGSLAGNQPMPGAACYAASKAFVASVGEALHTELRGTAVACTVLTPGPVRTAFIARARLDDAAARLPAPVWISAGQAAETGLRGLERNRRRVTPGVLPNLLAAGGRLAPPPVTLPVIHWLIRRYV